MVLVCNGYTIGFVCIHKNIIDNSHLYFWGFYNIFEKILVFLVKPWNKDKYIKLYVLMLCDNILILLDLVLLYKNSDEIKLLPCN